MAASKRAAGRSDGPYRDSRNTVRKVVVYADQGCQMCVCNLLSGDAAQMRLRTLGEYGFRSRFGKVRV